MLWDIRVRPEARASGTGSLLFRAAEGVGAVTGDAHTLRAETQNTNVPACRFYRADGLQRSAALDRFAYADLPDEVELMWVQGALSGPGVCRVSAD